MDDDTIPFSDALENLVKSAGILGSDTSFIKSFAYNADGSIGGYPHVDMRRGEDGSFCWHEKLSGGLLRIRETTFVSLPLNSKAIEKCGLPCRDYFIWADDTEYGLRFTEYYGPGYFDGNSKVLHKRPGIKRQSIFEEPDSPRLNNYYYAYRNEMVNMIIYQGKKAVIKYIISCIITAFKALAFTPRFKRFRIIMSGMFSGLFTWRKYYRFIQSQVKA